MARPLPQAAPPAEFSPCQKCPGRFLGEGAADVVYLNFGNAVCEIEQRIVKHIPEEDIETNPFFRGIVAYRGVQEFRSQVAICLGRRLSGKCVQGKVVSIEPTEKYL